MIVQDRPLSKSEVPGYPQLVYELDFNWIDTYLKRGKLRREITEDRQKLSALRKLDPANEDVLKNAIADLPVLREAIIKKITAYLINNRRSGNPFSARVDRLLDFLPAIYLDEDMIKSAIAIMPFVEGCMPVEEKRKQISSLEKSIKKKKSELEKCSPPEHFLWQNGQPTMDLCEKFEKKWRSTQARLNSPCSILGHSLESCKPSEQNAWRQLKIRSAMSVRSKVSPIPRK